jgi:protein-disulfide isomerase
MRLATVTPVLLLIALLLIVSGCATGEEATTDEPEATGEIAAYLGDEAITLEEVDSFIKADLAQLDQQIYEKRRGTLEQLVSKKLAEREAEARGISTQEYYQLEVASKVIEPTAAEGLAFYEQNKARYKEFQSKSYEELAEPIKQNLMQIKANELQRQLIAGLKETTGFTLVLDAPRVEVATPAGEPAMGAGEDAAVTIVEFSDYECPYCKRAYPEMKKLMDEYGDRVRLVYRDYPLDFHTKARPAAVAARCAGDQGKYWEYHENLMTVVGSLDRTNLVTRGELVGLDINAFNTCLDGGSHDAAVDKAFEDGAALGVTGTPTLFVNGRMMVGVVPYGALKAIVDEELERNQPEEPTDPAS